MAVAIIYHSMGGHTQEIAEYLASAFDGMLIEVVSQTHYNFVTRYLIGGKRALRGEKDEIEPEVIDVAGFDRIVVGTPVWIGHPTPAINGAVGALRGCEGKDAVIYATCGGIARDALKLLQAALVEKGVRVKGEVVFTRPEIRSEEKRKELLELIESAALQ